MTDAPALAEPPAQEHLLDLGDVKVRYWSYDADPSVPKPLLLMVHGFRGDHHGLQLLAHRLREDHRVLVPDLPGFGRTEPVPGREHDVALYAEVVHRLLRALVQGPERAAAARGTDLLGHSFGSVVAAHLTAGHPGAVDRLVLVNPICEPPLASGRLFSAEALSAAVVDGYYRLGRALPRGLGEALLRSPVAVAVMTAAMTTTEDPAVRRWIRHQHDAYFSRYADREVLTQAYRASVSTTVAEVAELLEPPVLLVVGGRDPLGSVPAQRRMAARMPDHRLEVLAGVGHLIHYEEPARTAELVRGFLAPTPAGDGPRQDRP